MLTLFIVCQAVTWLVIAALAVALLAVARQVGVLHMRVAPAGALVTAAGPKVGDAAPHLHLTALDGRQVAVGHAGSGGGRQLLMFVSAACPICKELIPVVKSFVRYEGLQVVFVGDDTLAEQKKLVTRFGLEAYPFVNGHEAGHAFGVEKLPHAVLIDAEGRIVSKGLVNSREHLESLVTAHEMGVTSVQEYLVSRRTKAA
jgi:methylamine dehydrogenase accessory protein MauD